MGIPYKLYSRMTDMAEQIASDFEAKCPDWRKLDEQLTTFQDEIGWPFKASQEQLDDWNRRGWPGCDCQNPEPISGAALVSNECAVHNTKPDVP